MPIAYNIETLLSGYPGDSKTIKAKPRVAPKFVSRDFSKANSTELSNLMKYPLAQDRSADTLRFAGLAAREGWSRDKICTVLLDAEMPISAHCLGQADPQRAADRAVDAAFVDISEPEPLQFAPSPYVWVPPEEIKPLDWIIGHWLLRDEVTFVVAPGGVGKTTFLTALALSLVTGRDILGKSLPGTPKRVWFWNLEDSIAMMTRSIQAAAKLHNIRPGEIGDRLFLDASRDGADLCTAKRSKDGFTIEEPVHAALVEALKDRQIDVLIVDPFVSSHEGNENDNGEMDRVIKNWCKIAQEAKCAIVLCHHTSKAGSGEVNTMSARGAVAMTAAARVVLVLNPMNVGESNKLGIISEERWRYVQVAMDKSNRAPAEKADWYQKNSVYFGQTDSAGAIEKWSPPEACDILTPQALRAIKDTFGNMGRRESVQSGDWAGYHIAEALKCNRPDKDTPERGKVTSIIKELLKQGVLVKKDGKNNNSKDVPLLWLAQPDSPLAQGGVVTSGEVVCGIE
jgi:AAA domain